MGETIGYCARRGDLTYHSDNCGTLIEGLKFKIRGMAVPVTLAEDMTPYTACLLYTSYVSEEDYIRHTGKSPERDKCYRAVCLSLIHISGTAIPRILNFKPSIRVPQLSLW